MAIRTAVTLGVAVLFGVDQGVYADLSAVDFSEKLPCVQARSSDDGNRGKGAGGPVAVALMAGKFGDYHDGSRFLFDEKDHESFVQANLPPDPDSASLFLCAMGSLGAYQAGRSVKKIRWDVLPNWYHAGGARQIGHAHALDFDLNLIAVSLIALFELPAQEPKISVRNSREVPYQLKSQFFLTIEAPRGPPSLL